MLRIIGSSSSSCIILHHHASSCIILHHLASSCIILHHASSCIILHHLAREAGLDSRLLYRHCRVVSSGSRKPNLLMRVLCSGPQSSVNLRTSNIYMYFIHFMYTDLSLFHIRIKNICCADCFVAFILLGLLYVPLKCAAWSFVADGSVRELEEGQDHWTLDTKARRLTRKRSWQTRLGGEAPFSKLVTRWVIHTKAGNVAGELGLEVRHLFRSW